jgi:hypothetical protein
MFLAGLECFTYQGNFVVHRGDPGVNSWVLLLCGIEEMGPILVEVGRPDNRDFCNRVLEKFVRNVVYSKDPLRNCC